MRALVTTRPLLTGLESAFVDEDQWEELTHCPICRQSAHLRDVAVVEGGTTASVCLDCEHGFLRRRPRKEWYEAFYSKQWDRQGQGWVKKVVRPTPNARAYEFCAEHVPPGSSVLDVGAGFGAILLAFKERGYSVCGIERSEHRARYVQDVLGIPCSRSAIESFTPSGDLGLMCMNHVLEHVSDPGDAISIMAGMLPEGGMVYIAVPDFWRGEYPPQTFHFVPHLSSFTATSLARLLTRRGFDVVKTSVQKDIQILAVKRSPSGADATKAGDSVSRAAFWDKTSSAVLRAFGERGGHHALVWFEDNTQKVWTYQRHVFSGPRVVSALLKLAITNEGRTERALPDAVRRTVRRMLPGFLVSGKTRMLTVDVSGDLRLPVHITHPPRQAPVWIK